MACKGLNCALPLRRADWLHMPGLGVLSHLRHLTPAAPLSRPGEARGWAVRGRRRLASSGKLECAPAPWAGNTLKQEPRFPWRSRPERWFGVEGAAGPSLHPGTAGKQLWLPGLTFPIWRMGLTVPAPPTRGVRMNEERNLKRFACAAGHRPGIHCSMVNDRAYYCVAHECLRVCGCPAKHMPEIPGKRRSKEMGVHGPLLRGSPPGCPASWGGEKRQ